MLHNKTNTIPETKTTHSGFDLLCQPSLNKGSAFSLDERKAFGLEGLLPNHISTIDEQALRIYQSLQRENDALSKYRILSGLEHRNEVLFYYTVQKYLTEIMPIIYTPTVGLVCQRYSQIFRRNKGLWITPHDEGRIVERLKNAPSKDIRLIVVTDNESILGLGDQGAGGMAISVGKLALYCVAAGIHPSALLPISLDVGTNNEELLNDPLYLGVREKRLTGKAYHNCIHEFVQAVKTTFPNALIQWEDFRKQNAFDLLNTYQHEVLSFNDDIQGTSAVALAGMLTACNIKGAKLEEQRCLIVGAGAAGIGIGQLLRDYVKKSQPQEQAALNIAITDSKGLVVDHDGIDPYKRPLAWPKQSTVDFKITDPQSLEHIIEKFQPTILIGTSGQPNLFSKDMITAMQKYCDEPIIMPFSNPTSLSEAHPQDILDWTQGKALVGTGSPFDDCMVNGAPQTIGQGNNVFVFPGIGLGALVSKIKAIETDTLSDHMQASELGSRMLYPKISRIREVSRDIATAIVSHHTKLSTKQAQNQIDAYTWDPHYPKIAPHG